MPGSTTLQDIIGLEYTKLGFFQELRRSVEALRQAHTESEQRRREISTILDGITDVMMVLSDTLEIIAVNHVFQETVGLAAPEGRRCHQIFRGRDVPCAGCPALRALKTGVVCRETAIFCLNGSNRQFEMVASPLTAHETPTPRVLVFKRDVTAEKELQAKYLQAEKMATVGMLAAGVAHEINNPLTSISGFTEGLRRALRRCEERLPREVYAGLAEDLETILDECKRCQDIVRALLTFSRPQFSCVSVLPLSSLARDVLKITHSLFHRPENRHTRVELDLAPGDGPATLGDEGHLKQVLLNLLANALDATAPENCGEKAPGHIPTVAIKTWAAGDGVYLSVSDNGCGVEPEYFDKLFEPFFTTKKAGRGIGVGLSTCYSIVQAHGGEISVRSEPGKGSCFIVRLPALAEDVHG